MADNPKSPPSNLTINAPPPSSTVLNSGFTPRSSSFPDNIDSDDQDVFDPTPAHSPSGPHYDELPPSYDEAQQQALHYARNGILPPSPDHLGVNGLLLEDASPPYEIPAGAEVHAHRATAGEFAREGSRSVPVQHTQNSETVPVGRVGSPPPARNATAPSVDQASQLLNTALQFTRHEPDADARYASRLTRPIAIPQDVTVPGRKGKALARKEEREDARRERCDAHVPGAWPGTSSEALNSAESEKVEEPAQFLRAYAKSLHGHSIRPAEFLDFLDGLNTLCAATGCTPADLVHTSPESPNPNIEIVRSYVNATNEAFFAPRGLKVSLYSFASLLDAVKIPEERGQRAGAVASILDPKSTPVKRAQALHPWVEALELNVSEPSISVVMLREMGERFKSTRTSPHTQNTQDNAQSPENEKTRLEREYAQRDRVAVEDDDPPHSIPGEYPQSNESRRPPFGGRRGPGFGGRGGPWNSFGREGGRGAHGPFGPPVPPDFEALGKSIGKWGEEFGKKMEAWGDQFGKEAAEWANDFSKRASGAGTSTRGSGAAGPSAHRAVGAFSMAGNHPTAEASVARRQETGIYHELSASSRDHVTAELDAHASKKAARKQNDDDDASSLSSDSSSDSDSDSDFDADDENYAIEYSKASLAFSARVREINVTADASRAKGKKAPADVERERALAIEKAARDKAAIEKKIEQKRTKRAVMREFRTQRSNLKREHRQAMRELRRKSKEWNEAKKSYREKKKALRVEKNGVRKQFRDARKVDKGDRRGKLVVGSEYDVGDSVWVVVENL
ncbi:hypothetical protein BU23DRAFT_560057 [Bimuria novae-zelandiae CBS 107.79]|uniref:Uncharacterized protein n=1 Tax=Bimuria novae-zelandiae CBS 107.79 TaxID=1447943 RepID=A0A6A5UPN3_9PLEO|nr:hypothetical protein BU23DRAFT_560057 [Bimuria novae-zelandiae CBS 107.79]